MRAYLKGLEEIKLPFGLVPGGSLSKMILFVLWMTSLHYNDVINRPKNIHEASPPVLPQKSCSPAQDPSASWSARILARPHSGSPAQGHTVDVIIMNTTDVISQDLMTSLHSFDVISHSTDVIISYEWRHYQMTSSIQNIHVTSTLALPQKSCSSAQDPSASWLARILARPHSGSPA